MNQANRIFISYSHRGNGPAWKAQLLRGLLVFEQHNLLDVWQDGKIRVSSYWDDDITQAMSSARIAVVLLTPESLESRYILEKEFPFLRECQQRDKLSVFPVICEPCDWKVHDWLRATQAPNESNPLLPLTDAAQDRMLRQLTTDIATELSRVALAELPKSDQPPAPEHIYLEKFSLTSGPGLREEKLIGREQELALLDLTFAQPCTAIVSLVAWGGVGKTMLVQHWLQRLQRDGWFNAQRVYAWSFYSQGTKEDRQVSEDAFLAHALEWFGVRCEPTLTPWDKGRLLADAVARGRTLLVLDGIEPLQYPPGPMGGQLRAPGVQSLLKHLARKANASQLAVGNEPSVIQNILCLVTTREPLTDLADFQRREGASWGSVLHVELGNLTDDAGAAVLHHAGANRAGAAEIKPDDKELLAASREVDGHALTLNLLGRFLARAHGGDSRRRDLVKFEEADRKEQGGTTFKMLAAFENWFAKSGEFGARQLAVLRMLGLFDRPAEFDLFDELCRPPVLVGLNESLLPLVLENWNMTISFLSDFELVAILINKDPDGYEKRLLDCHSLIREHFARQLRNSRPDAWRSAHHRLFEYLKMRTPDKTQPTLQDLQPLYEAVAHGCRAGDEEAALAEVFYRRIERGGDPHTGSFATKQLGAFSANLSAMACFFEEPWIRFRGAPSDNLKTFVLNQVALCLRAIGRTEEAIQPLHLSLASSAEERDWRNRSTTANNLSQMLQLVGAIQKAIDVGTTAVGFAERTRIPFYRISSKTSLGDALQQRGQSAEATKLFREAEDIQVSWTPQFHLLHSVQGYKYCDLLLASAETFAWRAFSRLDCVSLAKEVNENGVLVQCDCVEERAKILLSWETEGRLLDLGLDYLTLARACLYHALLDGSGVQILSHLENVQERIARALDCVRKAGTAHHIPRLLLTYAWLRLLEGDTDGARADLDEAWDIASRGPMRLHMADIHLHRARLFFREIPYPWQSSQDDLAAAEKLINNCGYHRRDEELADAKRAILGT